jgi:hypothetical protein
VMTAVTPKGVEHIDEAMRCDRGDDRDDSSDADRR